MAYYLDKHEMEGFVSPATQARFEKSLAIAQGITGTILSVCRAGSSVMGSVVQPMISDARARRTAKVLRGLSDHQLADIGVARAEIDVVAHDAVEARIVRHHV